MRMTLDIYAKTGGARFSRATWRKIAFAIRAADERSTLSRAVALAIGLTYREAAIGESLEQMPAKTLAWLLAAALARDSASPRAKARHRRSKRAQ